MLYSMYHTPFPPPRLSILITIQTNTQYKVIICQVLSTVYIHHTPPEAEEGRHTNPSSYTIKTPTCPFLSVFCAQLSIFKKLFLSISSHCLQVRLFKGAQYSACPLSFIIYFVCTLFLILPCSKHDEEKSPHQHQLVWDR